MPKIILLADDSITIQKVVELTFSDADYEVIATNNGAKAIEKLAEIRPDIVLADIIMPEKNGYEVCEYVKSHPDFRNIPVILLTGTFEPFDPERAERAGCDAVVTKPFESQGLIQKVEDLIASRDAQPAPSADAEEFPDEELAERPFDAVTQPNVAIPAIPDDFFDTPAETPLSGEVWSAETAEQATAESFESPATSAAVLETEAAGIFEAPPQPSLPPVDESLIEESPFPAPPTVIETLPFSEPEPFFESEPAAGDLFGSASDEIDTAVSPALTPDEIFSAEEPSIFTEAEPAPPVSTPSFDFGAETRAFNRDSFADLLPPRAPQEVEPTPPEQAPASVNSVPDLFEESSFEDMPAEEPPVEEIETAAPLFGEQPSFSSSTPFEEMEDSEPEPQAAEPLAMVAEPEPIVDEPFPQEEPQFDEEEAIVDMASVEAVAEPEIEPEPAFEHEPEPLALVPEPEPEIPTAMADFEPEPLALMSEPEPEPVAVMPEPEPFEPEPFAHEPAPFEEMEPVIESQPLELAPDESEPEELSEEALVEPEAPELAAAENEGMSVESLAPVAIPEASAAAAVQAAGMTDADVERIAKRVVEMLSDRAIREIAWEVIPDLAESIVRDRIRELEREG